MEGKEEPPELRGIIPQAFDHIFTEIAKGMVPAVPNFTALLTTHLFGGATSSDALLQLYIVALMWRSHLC